MFDGSMLGFKSSNQREVLIGGSHGVVNQQPAPSQLHHYRTDRHVDVDDTLQIVRLG